LFLAHTGTERRTTSEASLTFSEECRREDWETTPCCNLLQVHTRAWLENWLWSASRAHAHTCTSKEVSTILSTYIHTYTLYFVACSPMPCALLPLKFPSTNTQVSGSATIPPISKLSG